MCVFFFESALLSKCHRLCFHARIIQQSLRQTVLSLGNPIPAKSHEHHCFFFPGFKPGRRAYRNGQSKAERLLTVEFERTIGSKEVIVRPKLNWPIAHILTIISIVSRPLEASISPSIGEISSGISRFR